MTKKKVTAIPAVKNIVTTEPINDTRKRKVAAYARVSTDHEEQLTSYEAQVDYYTNYIKSRDDWEFAGVYADEGISGTSTKHREAFNRMITDALNGHIDLIVTKSVSRFARNTVDSLTTIRKLKENNVECYFEKESIRTFDTRGELLLTIMSSLAQEESRSISENVTWGQRKRFADGKVCVPYRHFLGYDKGENGTLVINEKEAVTVREIYRLFLGGLTPHSIAKQLTAEGKTTPAGKKKWHSSTVKSILTNEKYKGDALLQKSYTIDFLTKKVKINDGAVPQYYVENNHEGIVSSEVFEAVQQEMERRKQSISRYSGVDILAAKMMCGECGCSYSTKVWHSTDKYRRIIYQCGHKYKDGNKCGTPHFTEDEIKAVFIRAVNELIDSRTEIIENLEAAKIILCDNTELEKERDRELGEMTVLAEMVQSQMTENARTAQNQEEYQERYNALLKRYDNAKAHFEELERSISDNLARSKTMECFIKTLKNQSEPVIEFDEMLWGSLLDVITVYGKEDIRLKFKDGTEITVN